MPTISNVVVVVRCCHDHYSDVIDLEVVCAEVARYWLILICVSDIEEMASHSFSDIIGSLAGILNSAFAAFNHVDDISSCTVYRGFDSEDFSRFVTSDGCCSFHILASVARLFTCRRADDPVVTDLVGKFYSPMKLV